MANYIELRKKRKETLPDSYNNRNGCHNCDYCFIKSDYDEGYTYFCKYDAPERPLCGSVGMDESVHRIEPKKARDKAYDDWDEWSVPREVMAWGICDNHIIKDG